MPTWTWIVIGIVAAAAVGVLADYGIRFARRRRIERRQAEAQILRQEAVQRTRRAEERESLASNMADEARQEREQARKLERRAGKLDPGNGHGGRGREGERKPLRRLVGR